MEKKRIQITDSITEEQYSEMRYEAWVDDTENGESAFNDYELSEQRMLERLSDRELAILEKKGMI